MKIGVWGASGRTGRELVRVAVDRGHEVTALVRTSATYTASPGVAVAEIDLRDVSTLARVDRGLDALISGLAATKGSPEAILTQGAKASVASGIARVVWLGALGTGRSAGAAGRLTAGLLRLIMGGELPDKSNADELLLAGGATVFHAGRLTNSPPGSAQTVPLDHFRRSGLSLSGVSRATVARLMVAEAEQPRFGGQVVIPVMYGQNETRPGR